MFNVIVKAKGYEITETMSGKTIRKRTMIDVAKVVFGSEVTVHGIKVPAAANLVDLYDKLCKNAYKFCK